jgi:ketosteroid isomerase-like protein
MTHGSVQEIIDRFWEARLAGDKATVLGMFAPDAVYELVGAKSFAPQDQVGPAPARPAADRMVDAFKFEGAEQLSVIIDGQAAAVVIRMRVSHRGGPVVTSEMCEVWAFDPAGKVTSLRQFVDTDLVRRMIGGQV